MRVVANWFEEQMVNGKEDTRMTELHLDAKMVEDHIHGPNSVASDESILVQHNLD